LGFLALIFFGSFLYQDKKEREMALCNAFLLRFNGYPLLFGLCTACIAMQLGVVMELQMFRPYGAGKVDRCSLIVKET